MTVTPRADEIRWSLAESCQSAASHVTEDGSLPSAPTASHTDLVAWWRWRYSVLKADYTRISDLLDQALCESQGYRVVLHTALDALHEHVCRHQRLREQHHRLRDEYRHHREQGLRHDKPADRRTSV